ncbi:MAG: peptidoglycan DD-metalloendopeptidase family protein [Planctomycetota bacterium]|nr:peptidoglycan DD-metalloendopeptidase family protein [Planctomycetota bacterium]
MAFVVLLLSGDKASPGPQEVVYYLPLEYGATSVMNRGNNDAPTHAEVWNRFAFDFEIPEGTPVVASADGTVVMVKEDTKGPTGRWEDNNVVVIRHADNNVSEYAHLKQNGAVVEVNQKVMRGDLIGYSGNTGNSEGAHLHFCLRQGDYPTGESVPCKFADVEQNNGVPRKGDRVTSKNFPIRYESEYFLIKTFIRFYKLSRELGCLEASLSGWESFQKVKIDMPLTVLKDVIRERDEVVEEYKRAASEALNALKKAREEKEIETAVRLAVLGERDFSKAEEKSEFSKILGELKKEVGYKEAFSALEKELKYRSAVANAIKEETKLEEKKRKGQKVSYNSLVKEYEKALSFAPAGEISESLKKHIEELKLKK